ncbi:MAG: hypothetical protein RXR52_36800 [Paraburkholderia sp.]|jgi:hypothetical protein|uniref:hypothetical protein n=1 Tax=Paraburkholderia sp. TaxID=1926495 RepID=UPI00397D7B8B
MEKLEFDVADVHRRVLRLVNVPWFSDTRNPRIFNEHELVRRNYQIDKRESKGAVSVLDKSLLIRDTVVRAYPFTLKTAPKTQEIGGQS